MFMQYYIYACLSVCYIHLYKSVGLVKRFIGFKKLRIHGDKEFCAYIKMKQTHSTVSGEGQQNYIVIIFRGQHIYIYIQLKIPR